MESGVHIPVKLVNKVSSKGSAPGDRVYMKTAFPIMANGKIVIPPGSWVNGTITEVKRPGRVKGRGELYLRFDTLILDNGVTRDFRARLGGLDGRPAEELDRKEGKVISPGSKGDDVRTVAETTAAGASIGVVAGAAAKNLAMGAGIGSAAGIATGLMEVLLTRGPDAELSQGSTIDMVLDRSLRFTEAELVATGSGSRNSSDDSVEPAPTEKPRPRLSRRGPY